jgi:hypothetical protein
MKKDCSEMATIFKKSSSCLFTMLAGRGGGGTRDLKNIFIMSSLLRVAASSYLYCLKSSLVNPLSWMIFICFTMVLFPDSPAPAQYRIICQSKSFTVYRYIWSLRLRSRAQAVNQRGVKCTVYTYICSFRPRSRE